MNKYDIFNWIKKVIKSCETYRQSFASERLIDNFQKMYPKDFEMVQELRFLDLMMLDKYEK